MGLPQVERAITHKLLHHKRPELFPMLDSLTSPHLGAQHAWATIHRDLTRNCREFAELEEWFADLAAAVTDSASLTRLRIHDILLWGDLHKDRRAMQQKGRDFLS